MLATHTTACVAVARAEDLIRRRGPGEVTPPSTRMFERLVADDRPKDNASADSLTPALPPGDPT
jgi:hypothetical protein